MEVQTGAAGEGPEIVKLNAGDPANTADNDGYVFLIDNYSAGGYVPFVTTDSNCIQRAFTSAQAFIR